MMLVRVSSPSEAPAASSAIWCSAESKPTESAGWSVWGFFSGFFSPLATAEVVGVAAVAELGAAVPPSWPCFFLVAAFFLASSASFCFCWASCQAWYFLARGL